MSLFKRILTGGGPMDDQPIEEPQAEEYGDYAAMDSAPLESPPSAGLFGASVLVRAEPRSYREAGAIVDRLRDGQPVVVSFEQTDQAEAQRIRDFLRGAAYAIDGDVRKVASRVYVCLPKRMQYEKLVPESEQPAPHLAQGSGEPFQQTDSWQQ